MKLLFLPVTFIVLYSCSPKKKSFKPFVPYEFDLTAQQKERGITRVYIDSSTGETLYDDVWAIDDNGKERIVRVRYTDDGERTDSTIISLAEDFYEQYALDEKSKPVKKSMTGERIEDGSRFGKEKFRLEEKTRYYSSTYEGVRFYVKDTVMHFADTAVECMVFQMNSTFRFSSIIDSLNRSIPHYTTTYYGKGVGVLRNKIEFNGNVADWRMISLQPMKKIKAPIQ